jgi:hypothetical protein
MRIKYEKTVFGSILGLACILGACRNNDSESNTDASSSLDTKASSSPDAGDASESGAGCTREMLRKTIDAFYEALEAHDASTLSLASNVKYTENGETVPIGDGLWKSAGILMFKRSALDTVTCNSVTESTIAENGSDIILGLRIRLEQEKISEIEAIVVRDINDYVLVDPEGLAATASDDWETPLTEDERPTREQLVGFIDKYINLFPNGACDFSDDCMRTENGATLAACTGLGVGCPDAGADTPSSGMSVRLHVIDLDAGIAVGFTLFYGIVVGGPYIDFHMLKVRNGQVVSVHAVLAAGEYSGWE